MHITNRKNLSKGDRIFNFTVYFILTLILLCTAYPLYFVIISSISNPSAVAGGEVVLYPVGLTFRGYEEVFKEKDVIQGFINSAIYTVLGTMIALAVTLPAGYALSRKDLVGNKYFMFFFMVPMFIGGGMMPTFLLIKDLKMIDTIWAMVLPGCLNIYNMIIARSFFASSLPSELLDAARIDGCGNTRFFFSIALPLSHAIIAIMILYYGIGIWNDYFSSLMYITSPEKFSLQMVLRSILVQNSMASSIANTVIQDDPQMQAMRQVAELMKYSLIIISSLPAILVYPFIQKHFVKGVMIGSVKG